MINRFLSKLLQLLKRRRVKLTAADIAALAAAEAKRERRCARRVANVRVK